MHTRCVILARNYWKTRWRAGEVHGGVCLCSIFISFSLSRRSSRESLFGESEYPESAGEDSALNCLCLKCIEGGGICLARSASDIVESGIFFSL